jgi:hypothetical protein
MLAAAAVGPGHRHHLAAASAVPGQLREQYPQGEHQRALAVCRQRPGHKGAPRSAATVNQRAGRAPSLPARSARARFPHVGVADLISRADRIGVTITSPAMQELRCQEGRAGPFAFERLVRLRGRVRSACPRGGVKTPVKPCPATAQRRSVAVDHPAGPPGWVAPVSGRREGLSRTPGRRRPLTLSPGGLGCPGYVRRGGAPAAAGGMRRCRGSAPDPARGPAPRVPGRPGSCQEDARACARSTGKVPTFLAESIGLAAGLPPALAGGRWVLAQLPFPAPPRARTRRGPENLGPRLGACPERLAKSWHRPCAQPECTVCTFPIICRASATASGAGATHQARKLPRNTADLG